jgi:predicted DCC family thiol-disulfide oxidoreductase YuxK
LLALSLPAEISERHHMASDYPLKIFYDASCPVCSLEMDQLRARDHAGRLVLVDMSAPGFEAACHGLAAADLDAAIHAVRPDGSVVRGMAVLRLAYAAAGLGWLMRPSGFGPLRPAFDAAYRVFARHRKSISRALAPAIDAIRDRREKKEAA